MAGIYNFKIINIPTFKECFTIYLNSIFLAKVWLDLSNLCLIFTQFWNGSSHRLIWPRTQWIDVKKKSFHNRKTWLWSFEKLPASLWVCGTLYIVWLIRLHIINSIFLMPWVTTLPHKVKTQYLHFNFMQTTFFYLERFLKKLAEDQCSFITKGSIYHIKHMYIQPFTTVVDWPEIGYFNGSIYYVLYLQILCFYLVGQYLPSNVISVNIMIYIFLANHDSIWK